MKIMYIIKSLALKAGVERVMSDKMNWLAEHGYKIVMVTYEQGDHPYAFPLNKSVRHYSLDARFFKLSQVPIWKRPIVMRQMRRHFKEGLQQAVDKEQPDIIITTTYSMKVLDIILSIRTMAHRIIESHIACYTVRKEFDYRHNPLIGWIAKIYDRHTFARISRFEKLIVLTQGDASDWNDYIDNIIIIPNPVTFYPESIPVHNSTGHRIIAVGRLHEQKGFDMLINAFSLIEAQCSDWIITIFGCGDDQQKLQEMIHSKRLDDRILICPPTNNIYEEYQNSEFFVLSSRYEGYPLVLNEAMSCGIPCIAFRCKYGPEDAIIQHKNGLLAENGNIEDLAQQMMWMISHPKQRLDMGLTARVMAKDYKIDTIMQKWVSLFQSII